MIAKHPAGASPEMPSLWPALAAMTALQALVSLAQFSPGVLAPKLAIGVREVSIFTTTFCAVGMATSLYGGQLARRIGPCRVAALCALAVVCGMAVASVGGSLALFIAGLLIGLAFGPETPASSTLLSKLATPQQRPLIFSIRQTGNQIGAMIGSVTLPLIALSAPEAGFWLIGAIGAVGIVVFWSMSGRYDGVARGQAQALDFRAAGRMVWEQPPLRALALLSLPFASMQLGLNAFLVTFAVERLALDHVAAGVLLAIAQLGGLVGRLFWGLVATRAVPSRTLLAGIGFGMSAAATTMALAGPGLGYPLLVIVAFLFGLTASGWNGVFLAELARLAPPDRVAEATGAVLTASYAGLLIGPAIIAAAAAIGTLSLSFVVLAALALLATLQLLRSSS
jgi:MFS family permease